MRIAICYPPIPSPKGTPLLSQNRQFQWFHRTTAIYPVVPASAATLLRAHGHDVLWLDGIARGLTPEACWRELEAWGPDAVFLETKTPVVKFHWAWVRELKRRLPRCQALIAGDHVTAFPEETRRNAPVDAVLTGGDYDFALLSWAEGRDVPVDLAALPQIDRALTRWRDYATRNGNFLRTPGAYLMSARDCWYARSRGARPRRNRRAARPRRPRDHGRRRQPTCRGLAPCLLRGPPLARLRPAPPPGL